MKRLAIYVIRDDKLWEHSLYFLKEISHFVDRLIIVANDDVAEQNRSVFSSFGEVVHFDVSNQLEPYHNIVEKIEEEYDSIICCDSSFFGPIFPFDDLFKEIDGCKTNIYALETRGRTLVSAGFFVLKHPDDINLLSVIKNSPNWLKIDSDIAEGYTKLSDNSFYYVDIKDNIIIRKNPLLNKVFFTRSPDDWINNSANMHQRDLLDYIKAETSYDINLVLNYLVKTIKMSVLRNNLHFNYILPSKYSISTISKSKTALIIYIYYEDLIGYCYNYALSMPKTTDIYVITANDEMTKSCKKAFKGFPCHKASFIQMENRGRDVAAYLVAAKDVFAKYDYVCCMHDKKSPQYTECISNDFNYHLFQCNLSSKEYVENIISIFDKNEKLGMLIPQFPNFGRVQTIGNQMATEGSKVKALLEKLEFDVPYDYDVCAPLGTMFWVRGKAFAPMFNHKWEHDDFPQEPNKCFDTILHAIERFYPFAVQSAGYFVGLVSPVEYTEVYMDNLYWKLKNRIQQYIASTSSSGCSDSSHRIHFRDVKNILKNYIIQKFKRYKKKKSIIGNAYVRYIEKKNDKILLHCVASRHEKIYFQCGDDRYYSKEERTKSQEDLLEYYKSYSLYGYFFEIPIYKIKNSFLSLKETNDNKEYKIKWTGPIAYSALDLSKEGLFVRILKNKIYIENKLNFYGSILTNIKYFIKDQLLYLLMKINPIHKYILFSENLGAADNSFELFKYALKRNKNCYFLARKEVKEAVQDKLIKKHIVVFNSLEHIIKFIFSKKLITSFSIRHELFPQTKFLKDIHFYCVKSEWIFIPHGITGDKNSILVHKYCWENPQRTFVSSDIEKDHFSKNYEFRNVLCLGYPRMDKWYGAKLNNNKVLMFFTWRFSMKNITKEYFINSAYFKTIKEIVQMTLEKFPDRHIYYVFHHEVVRSKFDIIIKEKLGNKNISYIYLSSVEGSDEFNKQFRSSKYLITDYSSVAYDFAYKENSIPIYYIDSDFIKGHYPLEQKFYDVHLGVLTKNLEELEVALLLKKPTSRMINRKNKFFKFIDNKNCERIYNEIFTK